jgi:hypothetical protein
MSPFFHRAYPFKCAILNYNLQLEITIYKIQTKHVQTKLESLAPRAKVPEPREILHCRSLNRVKMPFSMRHFVETKF